MQTITFDTVRAADDANDLFIRVRVDDVDLIELVRDHESPLALAEGAAQIAGGYSGLSSRHVLPPSHHFYGKPSDGIYRYGRKTQVLGCECGEPGCWPLVCRILVAETSVVWDQFEQPHRSRAPRHWSYASFGPFVFKRRAYELALQSAC